MKTRNTKNSFIFFFIQLFFMILLFAFICELSSRIYFGVKVFDAQNWIVKRTSLLATQVLNDYDALVGWVLKPNLKIKSNNSSLTTGDFGIRMNTETQIQIPNNAILACGDSFTAGSEVSDNESWPAYLEKIVGHSVVNAATGGWGADQIILRTESLLPKVQPKIVIISFMVDDIQRTKYSTYGGGNKPWFNLVNGNLTHNNFPVPIFSGSKNELGYLRSFFGHSYFLDKISEKFGWEGWWMNGKIYIPQKIDEVGVSVALLDRLNKKLKNEEIPLVFLMQYGGSHISQWKDEPEWAKKFLQEISKRNIKTINSWDPLRTILSQKGQKELNKLYNMFENETIHGHMSPKGNYFIASLLKKEIELLLATDQK